MSKRGRPKGRSNDSRSFGPLGDLIRQHRLAKGLGLAEVAQACGCSVQFISNIEHGRAPLPWEKAPLLAECLGVSLDSLQAANLSIRSDFKSFLGAQVEPEKSPNTAPTRGAKRGTVLKLGKKSLAEASPSGQNPSALVALAIAAQDEAIREVLEAYQQANRAAQKRFVKSALKLLQNST
jgi:transcriptional regulator with XRE-family HTH domain